LEDHLRGPLRISDIMTRLSPDYVCLIIIYLWSVLYPGVRVVTSPSLFIDNYIFVISHYILVFGLLYTSDLVVTSQSSYTSVWIIIYHRSGCLLGMDAIVSKHTYKQDILYVDEKKYATKFNIKPILQSPGITLSVALDPSESKNMK
jgi:hypothetical protein